MEHKKIVAILWDLMMTRGSRLLLVQILITLNAMIIELRVDFLMPKVEIM